MKGPPSLCVHSEWAYPEAIQVRICVHYCFMVDTSRFLVRKKIKGGGGGDGFEISGFL